MSLAMTVVVLSFLGVVMFALHRRRNVNISMSILRRLFEFTIDAKDTPPPPVSTTVGPTRRIEDGS
jgi:hypothetical protein